MTDHPPTESEVYAVNAICRAWKEATGEDTTPEVARFAMMAARATIKIICCPTAEGCSIEKHRALVGPEYAAAFGECWATLPCGVRLNKNW